MFAHALLLCDIFFTARTISCVIFRKSDIMPAAPIAEVRGFGGCTCAALLWLRYPGHNPSVHTESIPYTNASIDAFLSEMGGMR